LSALKELPDSLGWYGAAAPQRCRRLSRFSEQGAPAWQVLSGRPAPWTALVEDPGCMAEFAQQCWKRKPATPILLLASRAIIGGGAGGGGGRRRGAAGAAGHGRRRHAPLGVGRGGVLTLETLALLDAMLSQHKLSAYEHYLHAASLALSVAVGLLTALIEMLTSIKFSR